MSVYDDAFNNAVNFLKRGDRVGLFSHGAKVTVTFDRWDDDAQGFFISSSGADEWHPFNVYSVNGAKVSFRQETEH